MRNTKLNIALLLLVSTISFAQIEITTASSVREKGITGEWKDGYVVLNDNSVKKGQVRGLTYTGNDLKSVRFRTEKGGEKIKYTAELCKEVGWADLKILSWPKNFKKPQKGNRFYVAVYHGKNISILFDPKASVATSGFNKGESLEVLVSKDGFVTKVAKSNFKKRMLALCKDNKTWNEKATNKANKKWFKYSNMYEVAKYYDETK